MPSAPIALSARTRSRAICGVRTLPRRRYAYARGATIVPARSAARTASRPAFESVPTSRNDVMPEASQRRSV